MEDWNLPVSLSYMSSKQALIKSPRSSWGLYNTGRGRSLSTHANDDYTCVINVLKKKDQNVRIF